jgi:CRP-like cAMP-binding protein
MVHFFSAQKHFKVTLIFIDMQQQESFYEILLQQPLFQGLGYNDLTDIVEKVKMNFQKTPAGTVIYHETDPCNELLFVLKGNISVSHTSQNKRVSFHETWAPPTVVGISNIFGISQYHSRTYRALSDIQTLSIKKEFITHNLLSYEVFQYNLLGMLSTRTQRSDRMLWESPDASLLKRFLQVCRQNFLRPFGEKEIHGKMIDLAVYVDATRLNLSRLLNKLEQENLIKMERKRIIIPNFEFLIRFAQENNF